eukprot:396954-Amphidinium_carterae.1
MAENAALRAMAKSPSQLKLRLEGQGLAREQSESALLQMGDVEPFGVSFPHYACFGRVRHLVPSTTYMTPP